MANKQLNTYEEIRDHLEAMRSEIRREFNQALAQLEADTGRKLADESLDREDVCVEAVSQYLRLLGQARGNRQLLRELAFRVRRQWLGWPIVEVWDGVGVPRDRWELVTRIWVGPEGKFWEAKEASSRDQERLDDESRTLYYKQTEPFRQLATAA